MASQTPRARCYSIVTITKDPSGRYAPPDWTVSLPKDRTRAGEPPLNLKNDAIITPWGTFNVSSKDIAGQHTRLDDNGTKCILLAFKRMILDDID